MRKSNRIISSILLGIYVFLLVFFQSVLLGARPSFLLVGISIAVAGVATYAVNQYVSGYINKISIKVDNKSETLPFTLVFFVTLLIYMMALLAYFPGGFEPDLVSQLDMATGDKALTDWHPALRIILFMMIPMKLFNNYSVVMLLQLLWFSLAFGYLEYVMYRNGCPRWLMIVSCAYVWLNPLMIGYSMFCDKDFDLVIVAMVLVAYYIEIICSKGEWLKKNTNVVLCGIMAMLCWFFRHNAPLFVIPIVVLILLLGTKDNKIRLKLISVMVISFIMVQVLFTSMGVIRHDKVKQETIGLPLNVWSTVMKNNPDSISDDTRSALLSIASSEMYSSEYQVGDFNSIKYSDELDTTFINSISYPDVARYSLECLVKDPVDSFRVIAKLTSTCWGIAGIDYSKFIAIFRCPYVPEPINASWTNIVSNYLSISSSSVIGVVFGSYGMANLIMVVIGSALLYRGRRSILHVCPLLIYNYGTMLLLTTYMDHRYFLLTLALWLPLIFLMFRDESTIVKEDNKDERNQSTWCV